MNPLPAGFPSLWVYSARHLQLIRVTDGRHGGLKCGPCDGPAGDRRAVTPSMPLRNRNGNPA